MNTLSRQNCGDRIVACPALYKKHNFFNASYKQLFSLLSTLLVFFFAFLSLFLFLNNKKSTISSLQKKLSGWARLGDYSFFPPPLSKANERITEPAKGGGKGEGWRKGEGVEKGGMGRGREGGKGKHSAEMFIQGNI